MRRVKFRQRIAGYALEGVAIPSKWHYWGFNIDGCEWVGPISRVEWDKRESYQFTGLHDKNGKEIYDGDWFKAYWRVDPFIIIFLNGSFRGKYPKDDPEKGFPFDDYEAKNGEVIGDICNNPELLRGVK